MPYKLEAQRKYFNANKEKLGKSMVEHWNKETTDKVLDSMGFEFRRCDWY